MSDLIVVAQVIGDLQVEVSLPVLQIGGDCPIIDEIDGGFPDSIYDPVEGEIGGCPP